MNQKEIAEFKKALKLYKLTTTRLGADSPSTYYYDSREAAEEALRDLPNGEIEEIDGFIMRRFWNGMTFSELVYWAY